MGACLTYSFRHGCKVLCFLSGRSRTLSHVALKTFKLLAHMCHRFWKQSLLIRNEYVYQYTVKF